MTHSSTIHTHIQSYMPPVTAFTCQDNVCGYIYPWPLKVRKPFKDERRKSWAVRGCDKMSSHHSGSWTVTISGRLIIQLEFGQKDVAVLKLSYCTNRLPLCHQLLISERCRLLVAESWRKMPTWYLLLLLTVAQYSDSIWCNFLGTCTCCLIARYM